MHELKQLTITDIVSFILRYRRDNAFTTETPEELYNCLQFAICEHSMLVDSDCFGNITGVIVAKPFVEDKRLHIHAILSNSKRSLGKFAWWLLQEAKRNEWTITATRHGKLIAYKDTNKLLAKLSKLLWVTQ